MLLGLLTGLLAVWCGQLGGAHGMSVQVRAGPVGEVGRVSVGAEAAGTLGRIALVLILGGVAIILLNRWGYPLVSPNREEVTRGSAV